MDEATVTFRRNHLVRLHGLRTAALNGKLVRIDSNINKATGRFEVVCLNDQANPPVPVVPARRITIKPEHFQHACEYCLVASAAEGEKLQMCGRCKTARYCNAGSGWNGVRWGTGYRPSTAEPFLLLYVIGDVGWSVSPLPIQCRPFLRYFTST